MLTVEPLIAATFPSKRFWPLCGGGRYKEVRLYLRADEISI